MSEALSSDAIVRFDAVSKCFGKRAAVSELSLSIPRGITYGLLGPNGAGKTTSLRMVYGVTTPTAGSVRVFGLDVQDTPRQVRARLGVTLQENVQIEALTPRENLAIVGRYHLLQGALLRSRVEQMIDLLELRSHADAIVRTLSGGYKRRLSIAMSLINDPELVILDEPTTGLDPAVRLTLWERIRQLRTRGKSVLLTTHYMDEAERLCDRVAIIADGRIVAEGPPRDLILRHLAREAIEFNCSAEEEARFQNLSGESLPRVRVGARLMLYAEDTTPILEYLHTMDPGERRPVIVRPANLEDVFLAVTGTRLEEGA